MQAADCVRNCEKCFLATVSVILFFSSCHTVSVVRVNKHIVYLFMDHSTLKTYRGSFEIHDSLLLW